MSKNCKKYAGVYFMNKKGSVTLMTLLFIGTVLYSYFVTSSLESTQHIIHETEASISQMQEDTVMTVGTDEALESALKRSVEGAILEVAWCGGAQTCEVDNPMLWWSGSLINNNNGKIPTIGNIETDFKERQKQKFLSIIEIILSKDNYNKYINTNANYAITYAIKVGIYYENLRQKMLAQMKAAIISIVIDILRLPSFLANAIMIPNSQNAIGVTDTINITVSPKELLVFEGNYNNITKNGSLRYDDHFTDFFNTFILLEKMNKNQDTNANTYLFKRLDEFLKGKYIDDCTLHYKNAKAARAYDFCKNTGDKDETETGCTDANLTLQSDDSTTGARNYTNFDFNTSFSGINGSNYKDIRCYNDNDGNDPGKNKNIIEYNKDAVPLSKVTISQEINTALNEYEQRMQEVVKLNSRNWKINIINREINVVVEHEPKIVYVEAKVCGECDVKNDSCGVFTSTSTDCTSTTSSSTTSINCNDAATAQQAFIIANCTAFCTVLYAPLGAAWHVCFASCNQTKYEEIKKNCEDNKKSEKTSDANKPVCSNDDNAACSGDCCSSCALLKDIDSFNFTKKCEDIAESEVDKISWYGGCPKKDYSSILGKYNSYNVGYATCLGSCGCGCTVNGEQVSGYVGIKQCIYNNCVTDALNNEKSFFLENSDKSKNFCKGKAEQLREENCEHYRGSYNKDGYSIEGMCNDEEDAKGKPANWGYPTKKDIFNSCLNRLNNKCSVNWDCAEGGFTYGKCGATKTNLKATKEEEGYICQAKETQSKSYDECKSKSCDNGYRDWVSYNSKEYSAEAVNKICKAINNVNYTKSECCTHDCDTSECSYKTYNSGINSQWWSYSQKPIQFKEKYPVFYDVYKYHVYINYTVVLIDEEEQYFAGRAQQPLTWRYNVEVDHTFETKFRIEDVTAEDAGSGRIDCEEGDPRDECKKSNYNSIYHYCDGDTLMSISSRDADGNPKTVYKTSCEKGCDAGTAMGCIVSNLGGRKVVAYLDNSILCSTFCTYKLTGGGDFCACPFKCSDSGKDNRIVSIGSSCDGKTGTSYTYDNLLKDETNNDDVNEGSESNTPQYTAEASEYSIKNKACNDNEDNRKTACSIACTITKKVVDSTDVENVCKCPTYCDTTSEFVAVGNTCNKLVPDREPYWDPCMCGKKTFESNKTYTCG